MTSPVRLAVVGCGAVARANLLPVLAGHDGVVLTALVDRDEARARTLADAYKVSRVLTDMDALTNADVDAVVLATPPAHHAPATIALAARGLHVFVEKPMAITAADAEAMVAGADKAGVTLAVGLYRRMLPSVQLLRRLVADREYGAPLSVDIEEGGPYGWPLATLDVLTSTKGGGGVLIDIGSHVIDVLLHVLPSEPRLVSYRDNSRGGIETDCVASVDLQTLHGQVPLRIELSRTRELRGSIRIACERATLELLRGDFTQIVVHRPATADGHVPAPLRVGDMASGANYLGYQAFRAQFDTWLGPMRQSRDPEISGRSVVPVVRLIEQCYQQRAELAEPWTDENLQVAPSRATSPRPRVLVTGAGGFLGCRTVELLRGHYGWDVVALIREPKGAARLARWPTEIVLGDICSPADMDRAMKGCDAVVHCAVGTSWDPAETRRVTVEGTKTVAEAALRAGVKRFVHISTMFVHRRDGTSRTLDESTPLEPPPGDAYGRNKLDAEREVEKIAKQGLSAIVLRPTRIYGPMSKTFTVRPLHAALTGRFAFRGDASVPANMVYVDNVVAAVARAIEAPASMSGRAFLISDPDQLTLREFYEYFAGRPGEALPVIPEPAASNGHRPGVIRRWATGLRSIAMSPEVRALVHRVLDTDPVGTLPKRLWNASPKLQANLLRRFGVDAAVVYRPGAGASDETLAYYGGPELVLVDHATRDLGYVPLVSRTRAMELTKMWAEAASLVVVSDSGARER